MYYPPKKTSSIDSLATRCRTAGPSWRSVVAVAVATVAVSCSQALVLAQAHVDWTTLPSRFTHDRSGQRTDQYQERVTPITVPQPTFVGSGYRNYRSTLQAGSSADNYHRVEQWGPPVQPYGEWRFPNRPYSVPYNAWGPQPVPFGGVGGGFGNGGIPFYGNPNLGYPRYGNPRVGDPRFRNPQNGNPQNGNPPGGNPGGSLDPNFGFPFRPEPRSPTNEVPISPWADGAWPTYGVEPPRSDREFFNVPIRPQ